MNADAAYLECEAITRREAKNFSYGIRLLRTPERQALSAVYALARRIDDIGDGDALGRRRSLAELAAVRKDIDDLWAGDATTRCSSAMADAAAPLRPARWMRSAS